MIEHRSDGIWPLAHVVEALKAPDVIAVNVPPDELPVVDVVDTGATVVVVGLSVTAIQGKRKVN